MQTDRLWIDYDLTFATPFHFGTGIREGLIDRTVIRDDGGYLYVPGSTLKGVLRERCEHIADRPANFRAICDPARHGRRCPL